MLTEFSYILTFIIGMGVSAVAPPPNDDNRAVGNYVTHAGVPDCSNVAPSSRLAGCNGIAIHESVSYHGGKDWTAPAHGDFGDLPGDIPDGFPGHKDPEEEPDT